MGIKVEKTIINFDVFILLYDFITNQFYYIHQKTLYLQVNSMDLKRGHLLLNSY